MKYVLLFILLPFLVMWQAPAQLPKGYSYGVSDVTGKAIGQWEWHNPIFYLPPKLKNSKGVMLYLEKRTVRGSKMVSDGKGGQLLTNTQSRYVLRPKSNP